MAAPTTTVTPTPAALSSGQGSLSSLDNDTYDYSTTRYPLAGLGTQDVPSYVTFNINLPTNSAYVANAGGSVNVATASQNNFDLNKSTGGVSQVGSGQAVSAGEVGGILGGINGAVNGDSIIGGGIQGALVGGATYAGSVVIEQGLTLQPKFTRVKKSIAIYMPDTMVQNYSHGYNAVNLTDALGKAGQAAAVGAKNIGGMAKTLVQNLGNDVAAVFPALGKYTSSGGGGNVKYNNAQQAEAAGVLGDTLGATGPGFTELALKGVNAAINPQTELIFTGTRNREYTFVFDFQPRSSAEAAVVLDIIKTFRLYAAPETTLQGNGRYFIPPAQFDISFFFMNVENIALPRISTCVLTNISYDFSHSQAWATFDDGMPVHINMTLQFMEVDIITRKLIDKFGY